MTNYKTPGVYVEEIPKFPPSVAAVDTAIPAFVGYTEKATRVNDTDLALKPTRIESLAEFEQFFGGPEKETKIKVTLDETVTPDQGKPVGIRATATLPETDRSKHILYYALQLFYANGGKSAYIVSVGDFSADPGRTQLESGVTTLEKVDEPTLIVIPEAQSLAAADFATLQSVALTQCNTLKDRFVVMDVHGGDQSMNDPNANLLTAIGNFRNLNLGSYLKYGAAYAPNLETVLEFDYEKSKIEVTHTVDDSANDPVKLDDDDLNDQLRELAKAAIRKLPLRLPPSTAVAGVYARVDADRGVWKAPANEPLVAVVKPTISFTNVENDAMNVDPTAGKSVNAIRPFVGKGTLVWGARTLAGNDNEWRYVNVRRFFTFVEESVKKATDQFTFEPNDANTWVKVQAMIENFLTTQWRAGALQGVKPEHAFYVAVGLGKTMTPLDILEGRMIVEIGMAAVRPAEFIILRFSHKLAES